MKWEKKGLIYCPDGSKEWMNNSVLTPQPFLLDEEVIRVYASFRDVQGVGRIGYIDVSSQDPSQILKISSSPVLDIGKKGCFDDNGLLLGDVISVNNEIRMYYVGFQLVEKVKFLAFSGIAISKDNGETFHRLQHSPVLDRADEGLFGRCIHTVLKDGDIYKVWYAVIHDWTCINEIPYPTYYIKYIESKDGINFGAEGQTCITCLDSEYRIGRPKVRKLVDKFEMRYTFDTLDKEYKSGYAESEDGISWKRKDMLSGLEVSETGFDSQMACYPAVLQTKYGTYMFYDGNGMGRTGFGYAELTKE